MKEISTFDIEKERQEFLNLMAEAIREDRDRFFRVADALNFQPKYQPYLEELETIKQWFRDLPQQPDFPNIDWSPVLPEWFPKIPFASSFKKDAFIEEELKRKKEEFDVLKQLENTEEIIL